MTNTFDGRPLDTRGSLKNVLLLSIAFHVLVLLIIPLTAMLFVQKPVFERPKTFSLVTLQRPAPPVIPQAPQAAPPKPESPKQVAPAKTAPPKSVAKSTTPVPKKQSSKPAQKVSEPPRDEPPPPEDVSELSDLLGDIAKPAAEITSVSPAFKYPWYLNNVQSKAEQFWRPPEEKTDASVVISFTIFSNGTISDVTVTRSSGTAMLDNLAVRAIKLAAPFGKLPPGFSEDKLEISCTLRPLRK